MLITAKYDQRIYTFSEFSLNLYSHLVGGAGITPFKALFNGLLYLVDSYLVSIAFRAKEFRPGLVRYYILVTCYWGICVMCYLLPAICY